MTKEEFQKLLREEGKDSVWLERSLILRKEEWEVLHKLSTIWFGNTDTPLRYIIARLIDEVRVAFGPPPMEERRRRVVKIREEDVQTLLALKKALGLNTPSEVIRGMIYMLDCAPDYLFIHPHDLNVDWEVTDKEDWGNVKFLRRILNKILQDKGIKNKKKIKRKVQLCWGTSTTPKIRKKYGSRLLRLIKAGEKDGTD